MRNLERFFYALAGIVALCGLGVAGALASMSLPNPRLDVLTSTPGILSVIALAFLCAALLACLGQFFGRFVRDVQPTVVAARPRPPAPVLATRTANRLLPGRASVSAMRPVNVPQALAG